MSRFGEFTPFSNAFFDITKESCVARAYIPPGTLVFESDPILVAAQDPGNVFCSGCYNNSARFKCTRCQLLHYCSKECQAKDWTLHKYECPIITALRPNHADVFHRALIRFCCTLET
jgi:hypothetical protein